MIVPIMASDGITYERSAMKDFN